MTYRYSLICIMLSGLIGCSSINSIDHAGQADNQTSIAIKQLEQTAGQYNSTAVEEEKPDIQLTDLLDVPELTQYIDTALKNNPSLQQSIVALNIAYADKKVARADLLPSVAASFSGQRTENSENTFTTGLTVSWELDVWQKLADGYNAAKADIVSTQANLLTAKNLLVANLMRAWLEINANQQLLIIEQNRLAVLLSNETLILERYRLGLDTLEVLDNAKTSTEKTKATIAEFEETLAESKRNLLLLTGGWDNNVADITIAETFPEVLYPLERLAVQNLSGRPDLQAAFWNIKADEFRTNAAYKALLPSFSLSASLEDMAETPSEALFKNPIWSLLGQISAPLFQGGELRAQANIAELTTEQSYWAYQEALLNAVNEVENAIGLESSLADQELYFKSALTSARRSLVSYEQNYRQGLVDIFDLLTIQQQAYDAESLLTSTTFQRLSNRIDLGLALGIGVSL